MVEAKNGSTSLIRYEHDGAGRRTQEGSTALYYSSQWQVIEEREGGIVTVQRVWSRVYVDSAIAIDRDSDANGTLDERSYVLQDANFNVTALVNAAGSAIERYLYDAYGKRMVLDSNWAADADGVSDVLNRQGHQGGLIDRVISYHVNFRNRILDVDAMRWTQEDPLGYIDGMNVFAPLRSNPLNHVDPLGLMTKDEAKKKVQDLIDNAKKNPCWDASDLCQMIGAFLNSLANDSSIKDYDDFQDALATFTGNGTELTGEAASQLKKIFESSNPYGAGSKSGMNGFNSSVGLNGRDNMRHLAGGLQWGKTGTRVQNAVSDKPQAAIAKWVDGDGARYLESRAEISANRRAASISNAIENELGNHASYFVEDEASDYAWYMTKQMVQKLWKEKFCD